MNEFYSHKSNTYSYREVNNNIQFLHKILETMKLKFI
jgi:hypothetical protein